MIFNVLLIAVSVCTSWLLIKGIEEVCKMQYQLDHFLILKFSSEIPQENPTITNRRHCRVHFHFCRNIRRRFLGCVQEDAESSHSR
jgi:hypothetical protein